MYISIKKNLINLMQNYYLLVIYFHLLFIFSLYHFIINKLDIIY
jgi:hypothetical protein